MNIVWTWVKVNFWNLSRNSANGNKNIKNNKTNQGQLVVKFFGKNNANRIKNKRRLEIASKNQSFINNKSIPHIRTNRLKDTETMS